MQPQEVYVPLLDQTVLVIPIQTGLYFVVPYIWHPNVLPDGALPCSPKETPEGLLSQQCKFSNPSNIDAAIVVATKGIDAYRTEASKRYEDPLVCMMLYSDDNKLCIPAGRTMIDHGHGMELGYWEELFRRFPKTHLSIMNDLHRYWRAKCAAVERTKSARTAFWRALRATGVPRDVARLICGRFWWKAWLVE